MPGSVALVKNFSQSGLESPARCRHSFVLEANTAVPFRYHPVCGERITLGCFDILYLQYCCCNMPGSVALMFWDNNETLF